MTKNIKMDLQIVKKYQRVKFIFLHASLRKNKAGFETKQEQVMKQCQHSTIQNNFMVQCNTQKNEISTTI